MEQIFSRSFRIIPTKSDTKKRKDTEQLIRSINKYLYIAANQMVEENVRRYWNKPSTDIPFLTQFSQVKLLSVQLDKLHIAKVIALSQQQADEVHRLDEAILVLAQQKFDLRNREMKRELADACKNDPFISELKHKPLLDCIPLNVLQRTFFEVTQNFLIELDKVRSGKRQLRQYSKGMKMYFNYDELSKPFRKGKDRVIFFDWLEGMSFQLQLGRDSSKNRALLEQLFQQNQAWNLYGDSSIYIDRLERKLFLDLPFKIERPVETAVALDKTKHIGVDLGYNVPLYWALADGKTGNKIGDGNKLKRLRKLFDERHRKIQARIQEASGGRGIKRKMRPLLLLRLEQNFTRNLNRKLAQSLIKIAVHQGAGVIRLEALDFPSRGWLHKTKTTVNEQITASEKQKKYSSFADRLLQMFSNWKYGELLRFIKESARKHDIEIIFITPAGTSKKCHLCEKPGERSSDYEHLYIYKTETCTVDGCPSVNHKLLPGRDKPAKNVSVRDQNENQRHSLLADRNAAINIAKLPSASFITWAEREQIVHEQRVGTAKKKNKKRGKKN